MWPRSGPSIGKDGTIYAGTGDGDYYPEQPDLRAGDHRREAEPADQGARAEGLVYALERLLAAQARPRHAGHRTDLRLQGQGVHGPVEQGVPPVAARHERARRRGSSHARLSHAAHLQRGRRLRRSRHVGRAGDVGGGQRDALGARCRSGGRSTRSSRRRSRTAMSSGARSRRSRWKTRPARSSSRQRGSRATWIRPSRR